MLGDPESAAISGVGIESREQLVSLDLLMMAKCRCRHLIKAAQGGAI